MTCTTHHICDCLERRMKALEKVAKKVDLFFNSYEAVNGVALANDVLEAMRELEELEK